jgi:O-antigen/teichoic acid export membrane protein
VAGAPVEPELVPPPATKGLSDERPLGLSSSLVFIISVVIQLIGFLGNFFVAHHIGIYTTGLTAIGLSGLFLTIASTVNGMADLRVGNAYTYFIARGRDPHELTATYVALRLGMVGAVSLTLFALAPLIFLHSAASYIPLSSELAIFGVYLITPLLWSPGTIYTQLWVARGDSIRSQYPLLIQSIVQTAGLITVAFLGLSSLDSLWGFAIAYVLGGVASTIYSLPIVYRFTRSLSYHELRNMFVYAWPLMGGLVLSYLWTTAPTFFVAGLGASNVAVFLAANGFRILLLGLPSAVSVPLFPHLTNLHVRKEYEQLRRRTWAALRYTSMLVIPAAIAITVYRAPLIDTLFVKRTYSAGYIPLAILAVTAIPAAFSQIILTALTSVGRQRLDLYLTGLQVAVLLGVAFLVLPPFAPLGNYGLIGAAIAVSASSIASFALNVYFMERILAVRIAPLPILWISVSSIASFLVISRINALASSTSVFNVGKWWIFIPSILLGFVAYYVVLAATGELTKQDVHALLSYVGLPKFLANGLAALCWKAAPPDTQGILSGHHSERSDRGLEETRLHVAGDARRPPPKPPPEPDDAGRGSR